MNVRVSAAIISWLVPVCAALAQTGDQNRTSHQLPPPYADKYMIGDKTLSPDGTMGVMYPTHAAAENIASETLKDYLVRLEPFRVITELKTARPYFEDANHGDIHVEWSEDSSVALVTLDIKWGPGDIFLCEMKGGDLTRVTNLLQKIHDLLAPDFRKTKAGRYNDLYDFVFENEGGQTCELAASSVRIDASATTNPKETPGQRTWSGGVTGEWDISQGKFTSIKVIRKFAGITKRE